MIYCYPPFRSGKSLATWFNMAIAYKSIPCADHMVRYCLMKAGYHPWVSMT